MPSFSYSEIPQFEMGTSGEDKTAVDVAAGEASAEVRDFEHMILQAKPTFGKRILAVIWDSLDKSPKERALIAKLDWFILSYVCVAYFVKYLDQTNVRAPPIEEVSQFLTITGLERIRIGYERRSKIEGERFESSYNLLDDWIHPWSISVANGNDEDQTFCLASGNGNHLVHPHHLRCRSKQCPDRLRVRIFI
jgi:hypothetical protein